MRVTFGNLIHTFAPVVEAGVHSNLSSNMFLRAKTTIVISLIICDVIEAIEDKCTIINIFYLN